jgi:hypothetical protein
VTFDFRNPDYVSVFRKRLEVLKALREDPRLLAAFRVHYRDNPWDFIDDWGVTVDPRNINSGRSAFMPFKLFPRQRELIQFIHECWKGREPGLIEKTRDVGASWCFVAYACTMSMFHEGFSAGVGSRKEVYVDDKHSPMSLFHKARQFIKHVPAEFRGGWDERKHSVHMRLTFPATGSVISGEAGDNIGRGDRTSIYGVDESAHIPRAELIEASLSATTDCRIDFSSVKGRANVFAQKRFSGRVKVFVFDWRDDPRKDEAWYLLQRERLDPVVVAQEIDRNYDASEDGIIIPAEWVQAAINAHAALGIEPSGARLGSLDVADEGRDLNAYAGKHGILLCHLTKWRGTGSDIFATTERAFRETDMFDAQGFRFDSDGLGAGVRGDAKQINDKRAHRLNVEPWRGSGEVINPDDPIPNADGVTRLTGDERKQEAQRRNGDYFANAKAQAWWALRMRFLRTYRAVERAKAGHAFDGDPDSLISIDPSLKLLPELRAELSQPTWAWNGAGKVVVNKSPDGVPSPNLADAVMMCYTPVKTRGRGFLGR